MILLDIQFCANASLKDKAGNSTHTRKMHRRKICGNKIVNYGMIFVSFAKIGIKFFNFSLPICECSFAKWMKTNADMFPNA